MIKTVVFDLDGTLLNTLTDLANSVNYALRTNHLPECSEAEVRNFLGNGIRYLMQQAVKNKVEGEEFEQVFQTFRQHYMEHCLDFTAPYAGIMQLLQQLKERGIKLAIVSNKLQPAVQELSDRFFKDYISSAVGESATVRRKPNPDAVLKALKDLGSTPEEAIYVGDSEVDLATSINAQMPCALVCWGFRDESVLRTLPQLQPSTRFAHNAEELLHILTEA